MEDQFAKRSDAKKERVAKNEFQRLKNIARANKINGILISYKVKYDVYTSIVLVRNDGAIINKKSSTNDVNNDSIV